MRIIAAFLLVVFIGFSFSCGSSEKDNEKLKEELKKEIKEELAEEKTPPPAKVFDKLTPTEFGPAMTADLEFEGNVKKGLSWNDAGGENIALFTQKSVSDDMTSSIYLYVYHFADNGSGMKLIRKVQDMEEKCGIVMHAAFETESIELTDIDKDAFGELTFMYRLGCNGDPTPVPIKLIMLENGEKYIIRGKTPVDKKKYGLGESGTYGGEMNIDPSFDKAPAGFFDHAQKIWDKFKMY